MGVSRNESSVTQGRRIMCLCQQRYVVALLGFLLSVSVNSLRVNISIAIVAMVNSTNSDDNWTTMNGSTTECPAGFDNSTNSLDSRGEFFWSPELQGYILSAGFLAHFLTQTPGSVLPRKFGAKRVFFAGLLISSVCNLLAPSAARFHPYVLLFLEFARGMGQALFPPAISVLMAHWFPKGERGFLSAIFLSGMPMGAFITGVTGGLICDVYGWPFTFYVFGLFSVFVAVLFLVFFFDDPENDPRISKEELKHIQDLQVGDMPVYDTQTPTPWFKMFTSLPTISLIVAMFGIQWMNYYLVSVHALYLGTVLHLPIRQNGFLTGGPFAVAAVVLLFASFLSFWINRHTKLKIDTIRKGFNSASCIGFGIGLMGVYFSGCDILLNNIFLYFTSGMSALNYVGAFVTANDMSPTYCGLLLGFSNTVGSLAGFIVPLMAGKLTNEGQNLTQWRKIFLISASISLVCGLIFQFLGSAEIQPWDPAFSNNKKKTSEQKIKESKQLVASSKL